jgi:pyruvate/2-oxoglutarate dehydrogenase complex dihydrolipoamide acyltransferase (E2) component
MKDSMNRKGDSRSIGTSRAEARTPADEFAFEVQSVGNLALNVNHRVIDDGRADRFVTCAQENIVGRPWSEDL